jgi:hypothetical protein
MKMRPAIVVGLLLLAVSGGCDSAVSFDRDNEIVVEGYLVANRQFGQIRLSRTQPVENRYEYTPFAIRGADVQVHRMGASGEVEEAVQYSEDPDQPGVYIAEGVESVLPLSVYELLVSVPSTGELVSSRTTVPGAYTILDSGPDTVVYQSLQPPEVTVSRSVYPGRPAIFVFSTESLDPSVENLTPFYRDVVDPDDDFDEEELEDYLINESPLLNEEGYEAISEDVLKVKVPWLAFAFYGRNLLRSNALDDNLYDFIRSQSVQQGGSTFAPGEIPNVIDHVEGGTGIFGSYSVVERLVYVQRPASLGAK